MSILAQDVKIVKPHTTIDTGQSPHEEWEAQKRRTVAVAQRLYQHSELRARAQRIEQCGDIILTHYCPKCGKVHYVSSGKCRDRLCPLCQWRLSRARYHEMLRCFDLLRDDMRMQDIRASMLTLTLKNCDTKHLAAVLKAITNAWHECSRRVAIQRMYGWARCLEITYNRTARTYHPHLHIMLLWRADMEADAAKAAVDTVAEWRKQLKLSYRPVWDYRTAYSKHIDSDTHVDKQTFVISDELDKATSDAARDAARECTKYILKLEDLLHCPDSDIPAVANAIKGVRFVGYGGALKRARALLGIKSDEGDDEDEHEQAQQCKDCSVELKTAIMVWAGGAYTSVDNVKEV